MSKGLGGNIGCIRLKNNYLSNEGCDGSRSGDDDVVAFSQQEADKASRKKSSRPRNNKKWSAGADLHLILIGKHLLVFCTHGGTGEPLIPANLC